MNDPSIAKLVHLYGRERAATVIDEGMREIGAESLEDPQDRLRFGLSLMKKGGLLEVVGRAIRVQAILHGARE